MNDNKHAYIMDRTISCKKAAELMGFHVSTIYRMIEEGELDACGQKRRKRVYESSIERYRIRHAHIKREETVVRERFKISGSRQKQALNELKELLQ